jgi:hypothetical protein
MDASLQVPLPTLMSASHEGDFMDGREGDLRAEMVYNLSGTQNYNCTGVMIAELLVLIGWPT